MTISTDFMEQPVNERKQGSAFPPNYIHSLDSSHMMYTCLRAKEAYCYLFNLASKILLFKFNL